MDPRRHRSEERTRLGNESTRTATIGATRRRPRLSSSELKLERLYCLLARPEPTAFRPQLMQREGQSESRSTALGSGWYRSTMLAWGFVQEARHPQIELHYNSQTSGKRSSRCLLQTIEYAWMQTKRIQLRFYLASTADRYKEHNSPSLRIQLKV